MKPRTEEERRRFFAEKYGRSASPAARELERTVLGHDLGLNGYTTLRHAELLVAHLRAAAVRPRRSDRSVAGRTALLDIGSAYGWPGLHVARSLGCRVVLTDVPFDALRQAGDNVARTGPEVDASVCAADARRLPFRSETFDVVVHADVLC